MIALDTNVLVQAQRAELPLHEICRKRLTELAEGLVPWALPIFCLGEFVRVVTHTKIFAPPTRLVDALAALRSLLQSPSLRLLAPGPRYAELLCLATEQADAHGNLVFDAQIAAVCLEHGVTRLMTLDRDFHRFAGLEVLAPG